ncbi:hypothetical protein Tco_0770297 [Tanacetum coccineum]|uniref:Uncharacterized protein n=1 Tax=Tanacetum coccineum TaxID=301880 RepID=A0ABQ4ZEG4_9ASTR
MYTMAEHVIAAGADNRRLMLEKSQYDSWQSCMLLYIQAFLRSSAKLNLSSSSNLLPSCALVKKNMISEFAEALTPL